MAKVIPFPVRRSGRSLQAVALPTIPVRHMILDQWLDGRTGPEIEKRLGVNAEQIKRVLWAWQEIHDRCSRVALSRYKVTLQEMFREIEIDVWDEAGSGPFFPPSTTKRAA